LVAFSKPNRAKHRLSKAKARNFSIAAWREANKPYKFGARPWLTDELLTSSFTQPSGLISLIVHELKLLGSSQSLIEQGLAGFDEAGLRKRTPRFHLRWVNIRYGGFAPTCALHRAWRKCDNTPAADIHAFANVQGQAAVTPKM
jgi:hypothetical protein